MLMFSLQKIGLSLFLMLSLHIACSAQQAMIPLTVPHYGEGTGETLAYYGTTKLETGEVLPWFPIETVFVYAERKWKSVADKERYLRLKRNVLRVLPYAIYAQKRYEQLDRELALANSKKEERALIKACEREIKEKINNEVKELSVSQGKILIKLIERQTGNTSYELLKDMKGSITASVYQGMARLFGHNLKSVYNAQEEFEIENIIREYEVIRPINKPFQ